MFYVYGKIFASMFHGSMVGQRDAQLVFVYLISHADREGHTDANPVEIAALTGIPINDVSDALDLLQRPDPFSRSTEKEGRRIERIGDSWAWFIVNYEKYRKIINDEIRREYRREWMKSRREKAKRVHRELDVNSREPLCTQGEVDVEVEVEVENLKPSFPDGNSRESNGAARKTPEPEPVGFSEFYGNYPRHDGRRAASKQFVLALKRRPDYSADDLAWAAVKFAEIIQEEGREARFIPLPATWLSQDRFREYFDETADAQT